MNIIKAGLGILFAISIICIAPSVHALQLSPTLFDFSAQPGQTITRSVRLTNDTSQDISLTYQTGILEASPEGNGVPMLLPAPKDIHSIADWVSVPNPTFILKPGEKKEVAFDIAVPENAEPGGHYAWVAWSETPSDIDGTSVAISGGVATQILLKVEGNVQEKLTIQSFQTTEGKTNFEKLPVTFRLNILNTGNVHEKPRGTITIRNMLGAVVAILPFNTEKDTGNILPNKERAYEVQWKEGFALGKYTAQLDAVYADGKTITSQMSLWIFPKALIAVWLLIIAIITVIIVMTLTRVFKKNKKQ